MKNFLYDYGLMILGIVYIIYLWYDAGIVWLGFN